MLMILISMGSDSIDFRQENTVARDTRINQSSLTPLKKEGRE